jgi:hypothetical protein
VVVDGRRRVLDNILIDIAFAIVVGVIGWARYAFKSRRLRQRGGVEMSSAPPVVVTKDGVAQQIPPQLQGVVDQAMRAAADGVVDADEQAALRAAALAAGAKGVAFGEVPEHLGPPPPGPGTTPAPPAPPPPPPPPPA